MFTSLWRGLVPAVVALCLWGCQHIPPQPVDFTATRDAHRARLPELEPVRAYLDRAYPHSSAPVDTFNLDDGVSLEEGQALALWYNPQLRIVRIEAEGAAALAAASGRWPDTQLEISAGRKEIEESTRGLLREAGSVSREWIDAAALQITVPLSGRLRAERRLFEASHHVALAAAAEAEWQTLRQVREAWAAWTHATRAAELAATHAAQLAEFARVAQALAQAGELTPTTARMFTIEQQHWTLEAARREAEVRQLQGELFRQMGLLPGLPLILHPLAAPAQPHAHGELPKDHPALLHAEAVYAAAEASLVHELRNQYPDVVLSPLREDDAGETSLQLGLGIPLPTWNANRAGIAEARAARDTARARYEAAVFELDAELRLALEAHANADTHRRELAEKQAPLLDQQLDEVRRFLDAGELDLLAMHEALQQAREFRDAFLLAVLAEQQAAARLAAALNQEPLLSPMMEEEH
ncbi:MAG: hypothetical protein RLZZ303_1412 [Candidatus Hydrogenedentota bacterium]